LATSPTQHGGPVRSGVYRFWRDSGHAACALLAGVLADAFGYDTAIWAVAALTASSGAVVAVHMYETRHRQPPRHTSAAGGRRYHHEREVSP
jgi:predicted MFS family arabinose efflux permease